MNGKEQEKEAAEGAAEKSGKRKQRGLEWKAKDRRNGRTWLAAKGNQEKTNYRIGQFGAGKSKERKGSGSKTSRTWLAAPSPYIATCSERRR